MRRLVQCLLAMLLCALPLALGHASETPEPTLRALLIGCDYFVEQENTYPAAENNIRRLAETLMADTRGYALIRTSASAIGSVAQFQDVVQGTLGDAKESDISLLYISTHGVFDEDVYKRQGLVVLRQNT